MRFAAGLDRGRVPAVDSAECRAERSRRSCYFVCTRARGAAGEVSMNSVAGLLRAESLLFGYSGREPFASAFDFEP